MKLTTITQVSVDGVMQGNGPSEWDRRVGFERDGWACRCSSAKTRARRFGYAAPGEMVYDDLRARPISRADLETDVEGINSSIETIQRTRGGLRPREPVS
jgi:hypothetical protein